MLKWCQCKLSDVYMWFQIKAFYLKKERKQCTTDRDNNEKKFYACS
jgi:hypothetical protein